MSNPFREQIRGSDIYRGQTMPVYLETIPGSLERICALVAAQGEDGRFKVARTLNKRTIKNLFGNKSEGINKAINWLVTDITNQLKHGAHISECTFAISGFHCPQPESSAATSLESLMEKTINLSTTLGGLNTDDEERQQRFSTQLKVRLTEYNKNHREYVDQSYTVGKRSIKFGLVTPHLIGQYHGIYAKKASLNSAIVKMVALEDLKLEGMIGSDLSSTFYAAKTNHGDGRIQNQLLSDLKYELDRREIPLEIFADYKEMADRFNEILSRVY